MDYRKSALKKIMKLIYASCCRGEIVTAQPCTVTPPVQAQHLQVPGMNQPVQVHSGARDLVGFLQFNRAYFYPSNVGQWTADVGYMLLTLTNEMGQHLGQELLKSPHFSNTPLNDSSNQSVFDNTRDVFSMTPMHTDTMRYLCGALTSIVLEGLYGKSPFMIQTCHFCLRNICCIDPTLGDVIMPFLLAALHPDAVNQSHMAPASMTAIGNIFKALLFPRPVMLCHLEELLELSLAGIDPSDTQKSLTTMSMYNSIFTWFPANTCSGDSAVARALLPAPDGSLDTAIPPTYLSIVAGGVASETPASTADEYHELFHSRVAPVLAAWAPRFTEKLLAVMDAKEKPHKGKQQSPMSSYIEESFFVVTACLSDDVRCNILSQVLDFCGSANATNAGKEIGKLLESLLTVQPALLPSALERIIDADVRSGTCSAEKLALRLRLIGACLRRTGGELILSHIDKVTFAFSDTYKLHSDKSVRKAVCKLMKDLLKGLASFYTLHPTRPRQAADAILGKGNHAATVDCEWHVPSPGCISAAVALLREHASGAMRQVESLLAVEQTCSSGGEGDSTDESSKLLVRKTEDKVVALLHILRRCLRGAAEVLGDVHSDAVGPDTPVPASDDMEQDADEASLRLLVATGRNHVFAISTPEDSQYLTTLRHSVICFLNRVQSLLDKCSTVGAPSSPLAGYANSPTVRSVLMKVFKITVNQRMAVLKNVDNVKKWFSMSKRMSKSSTSQYMERKLQRITYALCRSSPYANASLREVANQPWQRAIGSAEYWIGHDLCARSVSDRVWIQQAQRLKELSFNATNTELRTYGGASAFLTALRLLANTCGHEYDAIRSKANKIFQEVSCRFGWRIETLIVSALEQLSTPGTAHSTVSGALSILSMELVLKRIASIWRLQQNFFRSLRAFPTVLMSIPENDKRENLSNKLSGVFSRYLTTWHHNPLRAWTQDSVAPAAELVSSLLTEFGVRGETAASEEEGGGASATLRQQMYVASIVLTFIGHDDIQLPVGVWEWALGSLRQDHGQPMQMVALAALTKLACVVGNGAGAIDTGVVDIISNTLTVPANCQLLLQGLAHCHKGGATGQENAQWSKGIDSMFRNADYICNVLPRYSTAYAERTTFSAIFRSNNAFTFHQLLSILSNEVDNIPYNAIACLLSASKDIPSTNEEEARTVNATRAEILSGITRFLSDKESVGCPASVTAPAWNDCVNFLSDNTQRISLDYCCDYAEAIAFGLSARANSPSNVLCGFILSNASECFMDSSSDASMTNSSGSSDASSSGFTRQAKQLQLLRALLVADNIAVATVTSSNTKSLIGASLLASISERLGGRVSAFASPYLVLRLEISKLLALLTECDAEPVHMRPIVGKLLSECAGQRTATGSDTSTVSTSESSSSSGDSGDDKWKLACDTACRLLSTLLDSTMLARYSDFACILLSAALEGCGHPELEFSKFSHQICLKFAQTIKVGHRSSLQGASMDLLQEVLSAFVEKANHPSLHVRETVILALGVLLANNYPVMSTEEKKLCKDIFAGGFQDAKPEVQVLSVAAMTTYLSTKSIDELSVLAASYIKNSDILAARYDSISTTHLSICAVMI